MAITPADLETLVKIIKATENTRGNMYDYTITGATDWNMLMIVGGVAAFFLGSVVFVLIAVIWKTLPKKEDITAIADKFSTEMRSLASRWEVSFEKALIRQESTTSSEIERAISDCKRDCPHWRQE